MRNRNSESFLKKLLFSSSLEYKDNCRKKSRTIKKREFNLSHEQISTKIGKPNCGSHEGNYLKFLYNSCIKITKNGKNKISK